MNEQEKIQALDVEYQQLAALIVPYISLIRDVILHTPNASGQGLNLDLAPFVGANVTIAYIDKTSPEALSDKALMLEGKISASEYYSKHSGSVLQTRPDGTNGASGGGLGNIIPTGKKDEFVAVFSNEGALREFKGSKDGNPSLDDLHQYLKSYNLTVAKPALEPYLHRILEDKIPFVLEDHDKFIDNLKLEGGVLVEIVAPIERATKNLTRETREELDEAYGINDKFKDLKSLCGEQQVIIGGDYARDPSVILTCGFNLVHYDPAGKAPGSPFAPTYTAGQQCAAMLIRQDEIVRAKQIISEITSQQIKWRGLEVGGLHELSLEGASNMATCYVDALGHIVPHRGQGPKAEGYNAKEVFAYHHEAMVQEALKYQDLKEACIERCAGNVEAAMQLLKAIYLQDISYRAEKLAQDEHPSIIDYNISANITKDSQEAIKILACEIFGIDTTDFIYSSFVTDLLIEADQISKAVYFTYHPDQKHIVEKEYEAMNMIMDALGLESHVHEYAQGLGAESEALKVPLGHVHQED